LAREPTHELDVDPKARGTESEPAIEAGLAQLRPELDHADRRLLDPRIAVARHDLDHLDGGELTDLARRDADAAGEIAQALDRGLRRPLYGGKELAVELEQRPHLVARRRRVGAD